MQLQIEDPVKFKEDFDFVKSELIKLKKQMGERQKIYEQKEAKQKKKDDKRLAREAKIISALKQVQIWICENLSMAAVKKTNAMPDKERELSRPIFTAEINLDEKEPLEQACL